MEEKLDLILKNLEQLSEAVNSLQNIEETVHYESTEIKELATALALSQSEFVNTNPKRTNQYYKTPFTDLDTLLAHVRPILSKNGITTTQRIQANKDGQKILNTMLLHLSGEWMKCEIPIIPPKNDIHTLGSYTSYLKRISLSSLLGIATRDEDDDGENAMGSAHETIAKGPRHNTKYDPKQESYETITKEQLQQLEEELEKYSDLAEECLTDLKIQSLADMPKSQFRAALNRIRVIKNKREGLSF